MIYPDLYIIFIYICLYTTVCTRLNKHFIEGTFRLKLRCFSWKNCFNSQQKQVTPGEKGPSGDPTWCLGGFLCRIHVASCGHLCLTKRPKLVKDIATMDELLSWVCFCEEMHLYVISNSISIPRTQMTPIFEGQHHQNLTFSNEKHGVIWVPGTYWNVSSKTNRDQFANWMHKPRCFTLARETR